MRLSLFVAAGVLVPAAVVAGPISNITSPTSVLNKVGIDDLNSTVLDPSPAAVITASNFLEGALANSAFTVDNGWTFDFTTGDNLTTQLSSPQLYFAWAVTDPQANDFQGNSQGRPITQQDAGGAYFEFQYTPEGEDPAANVDFLQVFRQSINGGGWEYFVDNGGGNVTPFYVNSGGVGGSTLKGSGTLGDGADWMLDDSADCENGFNARTGTCKPPVLPNDETVTSATVQFEVFVATDSVNGGDHTVTLYSGYSWGYNYTNTDTPEPAMGAVCALVLAGFAISRRRRA